jgi:hypothetical protein
MKYKYEDNHKTENEIIYKRCNICDNWFICTEEFFYSNNKNSIDGLQPYCKNCAKQKAIALQHKYPDRYLRNQRKQYIRPSIIEKRRKGARKQKDNGYQLEWQRNNPEKIKEYQRDKFENRTHNISKKEWIYCKEYFNNTCAYCGMTLEEHKNKYNQDFHKEHAINKGSNGLDNCIPSCKICNGKKYIWSLGEWYNPNNPEYSEERLYKILNWLNNDWNKLN